MKARIIFLLLIALLTYSQTQIDFMLTLQDGVRLDCTKFIPDGNPPSGGWPCVVICHGFGLNKYSEIDNAYDLADEGFYSLVFSMRGQGNSEGYSNFISTTEANDLKQVIQYIKNDANTNDNKIAVTGGSQGGIIPFMAVCTGMQVKTIMPDLASPEQGSSWIENGSIKMTFLWTCSYSTNIVRYNPTVSRFRTWALSSQKDKWDSLAYYVPQNRDFINQVGNCQIPLLTKNAWQDKFFNTYGIIKTIYSLPYNNIKMYFGTMDGHGSDNIPSEENYKAQVLSDWLDFHLRGIPNNVMNVNQKFTYTCSSFPVQDRNFWTWQRYYSPNWPPNGVQVVRLYFHPNTLQVYGYSGGQTTVSFLNDVVDTNVTMEYLVNTEFRGPLFDAKFHKNEVYFDSPALLADATMAGTPYLTLFYSSTANTFCQFNAQIWEVRQSGEEKLVTRINWTDRNYTQNQVKQAYAAGQSYGHIFRTGSRIRIKINNLDNVPMYTQNGDTTDYFLRTNPFVLPVLKRGSNKVCINNNSRSFVELPLKNFVIGIQPISSEIPESYKLYQNYPNPFNPVTKIRFSIPIGAQHTESVQLIIYDIMGREVDALVNEHLSPGTYETEWNGTSFSSGIYFYRISAGDYSETKRMILVK